MYKKEIIISLLDKRLDPASRLIDWHRQKEVAQDFASITLEHISNLYV